MDDTLECYKYDCLNHSKYEEREKTDPLYNIIKRRSEAMERGKNEKIL